MNIFFRVSIKDLFGKNQRLLECGNRDNKLSHVLIIFTGVRSQCIEDYECPNAPEDPPMNLEDRGDCTSYILCVGGCAIQMKVRLRTEEVDFLILNCSAKTTSCLTPRWNTATTPSW